MFVFPDAAKISSNNMNVTYGNVQFTEVKTEFDELYSAGLINNMFGNSSRQDTFIPES